MNRDYREAASGWKWEKDKGSVQVARTSKGTQKPEPDSFPTGWFSHLPLVGEAIAKQAGGGEADRIVKAYPPPGEQSLADLPHKGGGKRAQLMIVIV
jgi:hypothetical protein